MKRHLLQMVFKLAVGNLLFQGSKEEGGRSTYCRNALNPLLFLPNLPLFGAGVQVLSPTLGANFVIRCTIRRVTGPAAVTKGKNPWHKAK